MIRADLFSGSLAVWNALDFAIHFARPLIPSPDCEAIAGEGRILFELFQEYTANQDFASGQRKPRGGEAAARPTKQRVSGVKTKRIYQLRAKEIFSK